MSKNKLSGDQSSQPPAESQIEAWFGAFQPRPGRDFYRRMQDAPWAESRMRDQKSTLASWLSGLRARHALIAAIVVLLVLVTATLAIPSLRAVAGQIMLYFAPAQADQFSLQVTVPPTGEAGAFASIPDYALTLSQAGELAGYPLKQIHSPPPGFAFTGAHFEPALRSVALRYQSGGAALYLTQRPLGEVEEVHTIAPGAVVETVQVGEAYAEYVTGGWRLNPGDGPSLATATPGTQVGLDLSWDPDLPQQTLRWQQDGMLYELRFTGHPPLTLHELTQIAANIG